MTIEQEQNDALAATFTEDAEYRSLSPWAVIALILGLVSAIAFAAPLLLAVPILGAAAAAIALRQISADGSEFTGRKAALWGLGLSVAFGVGAATERMATGWRLESEATEFAMLWFEHLRHKRPQLAHQLTLEPHERRVSGDLEEYYRSQPEARAEFEAFAQDTAMATILEHSERSTVRQTASDSAGKDSRGRMLVGQVYDVTFEGLKSEPPLRVTLLMRRSEDYKTKAPRWEIYRYKGVVKSS
jgi:hypothetical protein